MSEVSRWYPSKIDGWLAVVLALAPLASAGSLIAALLAGAGVGVVLGSFVLLLAVYGGLVFPMRYSITDDAVVVRHGLVRQRVPLRDLVEVRPTRSPLSAPALSLDRLHLRFGEGLFRNTMISPADKEAFLDELAARAGLVREGDRLVRRPSR